METIEQSLDEVKTIIEQGCPGRVSLYHLQSKLGVGFVYGNIVVVPLDQKFLKAYKFSFMKSVKH